jgi:hypothetical protein
MNRRISFALARQSVVDYWLSHPLSDDELRKYQRDYSEEMARQSALHKRAGVLHGVRIDEDGGRSATGATDADLVSEMKRCPMCQTSWLWQPHEPWSLHQGVALSAFFRAYGGDPGSKP